MNTPRQYPLVAALLVLAVACTDARLGPPPPSPPPPPPGQEHEPNNSLATADTVVLSDSIAAHASLPGDVDYFRIELQAGTNIVIRWKGFPDIVDWAWVVSLLDSEGVMLVENDYAATAVNSRDTVDPGRFMWYTIPRSGPYFLRVGIQPTWSGADPDRTTGNHAYSLRIALFGAIPEREPNGDTASANAVALGDTIAGTLASSDDRDFFALNLTAGTNLNLDVAATEIGCRTLPELKLLTSDGTELARTNSSLYNGSWNPRLEYPITATGLYFVSLATYIPPQVPGGSTCYFLKIRTFTLPPPGPGEPIRVIASGGSYSAIASSRVGDVYLASGICQTPERDSYGAVARLEEDGSLRVIADQLSATGDLAVDGSGNILVPGISSRHAVVWRITPVGERSIFVELPSAACALAVGPDGDVWVSEYGTGHTLRVDSLGEIKQSVELGFYVDRMEFAPSGVLYYERVGSVFKLENGDTTRLEYLDPHAWTFDRNGYMYVERGGYGGYYGYNLHNKIVLLDPDLQPVADLIAYVNYPVGMTFVPDRSGAPTKRLLVLYHPDVTKNETAIGELNPAGIRAPGP